MLLLKSEDKGGKRREEGRDGRWEEGLESSSFSSSPTEMKKKPYEFKGRRTNASFTKILHYTRS